LIAVLRVNFRKAGAGLKKIDRGEFSFQDSVSKREIDLTQDWENCFLPGQRVDMNMVFNSDDLSATTTCPSCGQDSGRSQDEEIEW
jgi:hypothetical protein